jgi:Arc/MetJ family transcription regulator
MLGDAAGDSWMSKTLIDLDDDLLHKAQAILGTVTKKHTVNTALYEVVRRDAADTFLELAATGLFAKPSDRTP